MKKILFILAGIFCFCLSGICQERHEMEKMRVKFESCEYNKSRRIEKVHRNKRDLIRGESSAYILAKNNPLPASTSPYAEYLLSSGMAGGTYEVTVGYRAIKNGKYTGEPKIIMGFDENKRESIILNYVDHTKRKSVDFKTNFLRGKNHILRVWLPTPGVEIDYIEIRKKLVNSKN